jgi:hypothetical protein
MAKNYPTIGEYNQLIQKKGGSAFRSLNGINLIPSRTSPIKVYLIWFRCICSSLQRFADMVQHYAIRCFLTAEDETINRYKAICRLSQRHPSIMEN